MFCALLLRALSYNIAPRRGRPNLVKGAVSAVGALSPDWFVTFALVVIHSTLGLRGGCGSGGWVQVMDPAGGEALKSTL